MSLEKIKTLMKKHYLANEDDILEIVSLQNSANETFVVCVKNGESGKKFFIKMYKPSEGRAVENCELWIRDILPPHVMVPHVIAVGYDTENNYLITAFIEGTSLLERVAQSSLLPVDFRSITEKILDFIRACSTVSIDGFGSLDGISKKGEFASLTNFVKDNVKNAYTLFLQGNIDDKEIIDYVEKYFTALNQYIEDYPNAFHHPCAKLVPVDLNLNNFIINKDNQVVMTDLESFAGGDPLLAIGEWYAHIYRSEFESYFNETLSNFDESEKRTIHFYALLSNFNVFCFCAAHNVPNLKQLTPWGNPKPFIELMAEHEERMELYKIIPPIIDTM